MVNIKWKFLATFHPPLGELLLAEALKWGLCSVLDIHNCRLHGPVAIPVIFLLSPLEDQLKGAWVVGTWQCSLCTDESKITQYVAVCLEPPAHHLVMKFASLHTCFLLFIFNLSLVILRNQKIYWKYMYQLIS